MTGRRDLAGLIAGAGTPERTVAPPPPRPEPTSNRSHDPTPVNARRAQPTNTRSQARSPKHDRPAVTRREFAATVRITVNIPLTCKHWLADQARQHQCFVSEVLMRAIETHGDHIGPSSGRARRPALPDGTIHSIVLPSEDRERIDALAHRLKVSRSVLVTDVLLAAERGPTLKQAKAGHPRA